MQVGEEAWGGAVSVSSRSFSLQVWGILSIASFVSLPRRRALAVCNTKTRHIPLPIALGRHLKLLRLIKLTLALFASWTLASTLPDSSSPHRIPFSRSRPPGAGKTERLLLLSSRPSSPAHGIRRSE